MLATRQRTHERIGIKIWTRNINYVANEVMRIWLEIAQARGMNVDYLVARRKVILDGLYTWMTTRTLKNAVMEVYDPNDGGWKATERWDMVFSYNTEGNDLNKLDTYLDRVLETAQLTLKLPSGTVFRVLVELHPGAPKVSGWEDTTYRDTSHLQSRNIGSVIDTSRIGVQMEYYGQI